MTRRVFSWLLAIFVIQTPPAASQTMGDRLVVTVNNTSYTQRQVEVYVVVRESLRSEDPRGVQIVDVRNWEVALKFFSEEMSIYQEAIRLGSVQLPQEILRRSAEKARTVLASDTKLKNVGLRLGIDDLTLSRNLNSILRVEAFRKSRSRQEAIAGKQSTDDRPKWMVELYERTIIRFFDGSLSYVEIQPTQGKPINAF